MNNQNQILNMHANPIVLSVNSPFNEVTFRNSLSSGYQTAYNKHYKEGGCCCTCGKGLSLLLRCFERKEVGAFTRRACINGKRRHLS